MDVQLDLNANTSVADVISFANTYGLTIANETSLTDTTKKVGSLTVGVNTFTSVNKPYLYDLQSPITVTIVP
ncbi:hypothetical protein SDC9_194030 [bioreactor metagenome]|uniref:Uncharacterized protein n=1 Tax=bioreactor metagenome TaxID=1076179 RepID=A0A645IDS7_9ZZZZ